MKDRNGKELREGDIVLSKTPEGKIFARIIKIKNNQCTIRYGSKEVTIFKYTLSQAQMLESNWSKVTRLRTKIKIDV